MKNVLLSAFCFCLFMLFCPLVVSAIKPLKEYPIIPDTLHVPYEKNTIITSDGVHLNSWTFLPVNGNNHTTLVFAYADGGNMSSYIGYALTAAQLGYTILMFDYRGFGQSDNFKIEKDQLYYVEFERDLIAAFGFAKDKYKNKNNGIWALSMGTIITTLTASITMPDFLVADGLVVDPIALQSLWAKKGRDFKLPNDAKSYKNCMYNMNMPMLIFSGTKDEICTPESINHLKELKPSIQIKSYEEGHLAAFYVLSKEYEGSEYLQEIDLFLGSLHKTK